MKLLFCLSRGECRNVQHGEVNCTRFLAEMPISANPLSLGRKVEAKNKLGRELNRKRWCNVSSSTVCQAHYQTIHLEGGGIKHFNMNLSVNRNKLFIDAYKLYIPHIIYVPCLQGCWHYSY